MAGNAFWQDHLRYMLHKNIGSVFRLRHDPIKLYKSAQAAAYLI